MAYYGLGDSFRWFIGRVVDLKDPEYLGRVRIRVIHDQTGELGEKSKNFGFENEDLLFAWPLSAIQSASLSWKKIKELEEFDVPDWIDAVGLSPTGIAIGTYVFGFYLDGHESNIPLIFGTYHKLSVYPEPGKDPKTMLQDKPPTEVKQYHDITALAKGYFFDPETRTSDGEFAGDGQILPKEPYAVNKLWTPNDKTRSPVDEFPTAYGTLYPYNTTYTTKSGHAIELDDTPGHERLHIWHRSGCYEEISNGPAPLIDDDSKKDYPIDGPVGYNYITAGGVQENDYKGRRNRKTMDSLFDVVLKDRNELTRRDHNVEVANTVTTKVGNTVHWTIGWSQPPGNRKNDNGSTDYFSGGLDNKNLFIDVANNYVTTAANNIVVSIGATPKQEHRLTKKDTANYYIQVGNNQSVNIGNNHFTQTGGNYITNVGDNHKLNVVSDSNIEVSGEQNIKVANGLKIESNVTVFGGMMVNGSLGTSQGASGTFTSADGKMVVVVNGIITKII